jgi:hypothetical protein
MPVGPGVMPEERYAELSKAADLRAITQEHGPHSWTRHGYTYEEKDAKKSAEMGPNWKYMRVFSYADLVKENESNTFTVCAFEGKPHLVAKVQIPPEDIPKLRSTIEAGKKVSIDAAIEKFQTTRSIILRTSCYAYPTYPVIYNRALIVVDFGPRPNSIKGILVESATNFTEANFQEWAITLQRTQSMSIHVYSSTGEHLASGDTQIDPEIVSMVINAIDQADTLFKKIPEELRNFKEATQEFFRDHPEPFLFEKTPKEDTQHRI